MTSSKFARSKFYWYF